MGAGVYLASTTMVVTVDDGESGRNLGLFTTNSFSVDTRPPEASAGQAPFYPDGSVYPVSLTLNYRDDNPFEVIVDQYPDFRNAVYVPYGPNGATTTSLTVKDQLNYKLVDLSGNIYVKLRDSIGNESQVFAYKLPPTMESFFVTDVSNADAGIYQEFISWKKASTTVDYPRFFSYLLYRSTNVNGPFDLISTTSLSTNFFVDKNLDGNTTYYYKLSALWQQFGHPEVPHGISAYKNIIADKPDGRNTDLTPPLISNVDVVSTTTQTATIQWDTDEPSDSLVAYDTDQANLSSTSPQVGVVTLTDSTLGSIGSRHQVVLSGLTPNTPYYFFVRSTDVLGNLAEETRDKLSVPLTFTTKAGPTIDSVATTSITANSAVITWNTSSAADSRVVYSKDPGLASSTAIADATMVLNHTIKLDGLDYGTNYYFRVESSDNETTAVGLHIVDGVAEPYSLTTVSDVTGPTIGTVTCEPVSDTAMLIRYNTTDEPSVGSLHYGTTTASSTELYTDQLATTTDLNFDNTFSLSNLIASTTYYFRILAADQFNNPTMSSEYSCSTGEKMISEKQAADQAAQLAAQQVASSTSGLIPADQKEKHTGEVMTEADWLAKHPPAGGGAAVIVNGKTDKTPPSLKNLTISNITSDSAVVNWTTDELADSFVRFGKGGDFSKGYGDPVLTTNHSATIYGLEPNTEYGYYAASKDDAGNLGTSTTQTFTTKTILEDVANSGNTTEQKNLELAKKLEELSTKMKTADGKEKLLLEAAQKAFDIMKMLSGQVSLNKFAEDLTVQYDAFEQIASIIPAPILSGQPTVETTPTTATISWTSDKLSNSLVALVTDSVFGVKKGLADPYSLVFGKSEENVAKHSVTATDLKPDTTYHYQLRSKAKLGPMAKSNDFTFKTQLEKIEITDFNVDIVGNNKANFKWLTNLEANAQIQYTPYRDSKLLVAETKSYIDKNYDTTHQITISDFEPGTVYKVELTSIDRKGVQATKELSTFSTVKNTAPPEISQIITESTLQQSKSAKAQTIISWNTDRPTICEVNYGKGVVKDDAMLTENFAQEAGYSKKHIAVLSKLDPGQVYTFKIKATDSQANQATSDTHTILTPRQKEGVFDLIIRTMEETFGWVGTVGK